MRQALPTSTPYQAPVPHPAGHPPSALDSTDYDVIVIGAGPVGENVADYATGGGLSVLVVERELVGGECSSWACIPSNVLLRSREAVAAARAVDGAEQAVAAGVDAAAVLARRAASTHRLDDSSQVSWLDTTGIALVRGQGHLVGERTVEVRCPASSRRPADA